MSVLLLSASLNQSAKEWFHLLGHKVFQLLKLGFVKILLLKTSSLSPVHHPALIPSPAHRSDNSTIFQTSITHFLNFCCLPTLLRHHDHSLSKPCNVQLPIFCVVFFCGMKAKKLPSTFH